MAQPATQMAKQAVRTFRELHGVVISAGLMDKTVKVRVGGQKWNSFLKKFFDDPKTHLVHDPNNSLRLGDVVAITPGWRTSQHKRHVVKHIIAPGAGVPIEGRPPVPTEEERLAERESRRHDKTERRTAKRMISLVEHRLGIAEQLLKRTRKEFALRARRMGVVVDGGSGGGGERGGGGEERGRQEAGDAAP
ncbi:nucleic acid-binding protein [Parathielavia hyrcaniae]|uniref:Nucleic acid-binding protein n=1 Tax=Parathielavia hyrcaniae TaxID=113614 RepID=A0AAN6Q2T9_9PEZI|nr:nucleic acid-binding protein [Parathielavia hyrcaniae]